MQTFIALFRGINVGGNNILPMKELVKILESLGCEKTRTYIQSGNAVFQSAGDRPLVGRRMSEEIGERYGFTPKVLLLTLADLKAAVAANPFPTNLGKELHFFFLESQPSAPNLARLNELKVGREAFLLHDRVFYLYAPDGVGRSKLAARVEQCLGVLVTARNWNTVQKLLALAGEENR